MGIIPWSHFRGVHHTTESGSAVCIIPRSQENKVSEKTQRWASHCGVRLLGVHLSTESSSMVCITPLSQVTQISQKTLRSASHRRVKLRGVHHTTESSFAVCIIPRSQALRCASHRGVKLHTAESESKISVVSGCF